MTAASVQAIRFCGDRLELIDQRLLPAQLRYHVYRSAAEVAEAIRAMVVRGAPAIACAAAFGLALEARRLEQTEAGERRARLDQALSLLAGSRPTAVNLGWALRRMSLVLDDGADRLVAEAEAILREDLENNRRLGEHGAPLLRDGSTVLTHCNAGALATAGHGTALGVIRSAIQAGKRISVLADETRPYLQGARLTAWELAEDGIPVTLITDSMAGHFMQRGEVQAVIVGCDRVAANGDVANKIGTYMVAVLARRHRIPFYVACPLATIDPATPSGEAIPIEERASEEVTDIGGVRWAPAGVKARHPAFDVTPAELVTALITERGVVTPDAASIARLLAA
jgi:methylthioribose-1-phosphate isomerase